MWSAVLSVRAFRHGFGFTLLVCVCLCVGAEEANGERACCSDAHDRVSTDKNETYWQGHILHSIKRHRSSLSLFIKHNALTWKPLSPCTAAALPPPPASLDLLRWHTADMKNNAPGSILTLPLIIRTFPYGFLMVQCSDVIGG